METWRQKVCLQYIQEKWQAVRPLVLRTGETYDPPWGVWIRCFGPLEPGATTVADGTNRVDQVWFLDRTGIFERDPSEYARFVLGTSVAARDMGHPQRIFGIVHKVAVAAFANYAHDPDLVYVDVIWGVRWGDGEQIRISVDRRLEVVAQLWRS